MFLSYTGTVQLSLKRPSEETELQLADLLEIFLCFLTPGASFRGAAI